MVCEACDRKRCKSESVELEIFVITLLLLLLFLFRCSLALGVRRVVYNLEDVGVDNLTLGFVLALYCILAWRCGGCLCAVSS